MRAVHFLGEGKVELSEVPTPRPRGSEVLVRVKSASICGTDRENLMGPGQKTVPGHENAGEVIAVDTPSQVRVGDRVAVNCHVTCGVCDHCRSGDLHLCDRLSVIGFDRDGGYADCLLVPEACCMRIPESIGYEEASLMVDMLGTPFQAFKRAQVAAGERIAIWGAGPIGLGLLMTAKQAGAQVAIIDMSEYRLRLAGEFAPDLVLDPGSRPVPEALMEWSGGRGVRVGFDCVGSEKACLQALASLSKKGTLVVVGVSHRLTLDPWEHFIRREYRILGTRNFNTRLFDEMVAAIEAGLPLRKVVTHRFSIEKAEEAFALFRSGECGKILIVDQEGG
jgi:threonine dehydrogenase-like Zn-dependent dehydrogenase